MYRILDVGHGVELDVEQPGRRLLDTADIDGLDDVAGFRIDHDRTARALPAHPLGSRNKRIAVSLATSLFQGCIDQVCAVVTADREEVRVAVELVVVRL